MTQDWMFLLPAVLFFRYLGKILIYFETISMGVGFGYPNTGEFSCVKCTRLLGNQLFCNRLEGQDSSRSNCEQYEGD